MPATCPPFSIPPDTSYILFLTPHYNSLPANSRQWNDLCAPMAAILPIPCMLSLLPARPRYSIRNKFVPLASSPHRDPKTFLISVAPRLKSSKGATFAVEDDRASVASAVAEKPEGGVEEGGNDGGEGEEDKQEVDWKDDEEFKKFMGSPSIEAAIKLEKKRADRKLKELDRESGGGNLLTRLINAVVRGSLEKEKERLEKAEETFVALDLNKVKEISKGMLVILVF